MLGGLMWSGCVGWAGQAEGLVDAGERPTASPVDAGTPPPAERDAGVDGGVDAGLSPADAGSNAVDAGEFGAARCGDAQFEVCDDFESQSALWSYGPAAGGTGLAEIDGSKSARGTHSLHLRSGVQLRAAKDWPFLTKGFFLRAFMWWGQPVGDWHRTYFWAVDPVVGGAFTLGSYHGQLAINEYGPNNGDTGVAARDPLPVGRWACVEWQVTATNEVHAWVDEAEVPAEAQNPFGVPTMHVTNWPPMQWTQFIVEFSTATSTDELWIDSLALAGSRIGCSR